MFKVSVKSVKCLFYFIMIFYMVKYVVHVVKNIGLSTHDQCLVIKVLMCFCAPVEIEVLCSYFIFRLFSLLLKKTAIGTPLPCVMRTSGHV